MLAVNALMPLRALALTKKKASTLQGIFLQKRLKFYHLNMNLLQYQIEGHKGHLQLKEKCLKTVSGSLQKPLLQNKKKSECVFIHVRVRAVYAEVTLKHDCDIHASTHMRLFLTTDKGNWAFHFKRDTDKLTKAENLSRIIRFTGCKMPPHVVGRCSLIYELRIQTNAQN